MASSYRSTLPFVVLLAGLGLGQTAAAAPVVDIVDGALDPQACNGQGCWTNHLRVSDLDADGDLDILLANYSDFFGGSNDPEPLVMYQNDGAGSFTDVSGPALGDFTGNIRMAAVGDVNGDGAADIYAPDAIGGAPALFINDGNGTFTDEGDLRLPMDFPSAAATRMGDVDNDGDLDIVAADGYANSGPPYGHVYLNDGAGMFVEAEGAVPDMIDGQDIDDIELLDVDRDFDLDLMVNAHVGGTGALWLNDGSGNFSAQTTVDPPATGNFHYNIAPCDVDGDGDLDLWIDNIGGNFREQLLINDGSGNYTDETMMRVSGNPSADDNGVICVDVDDDGDFDAVVLSLGTPERLLVNDGRGMFNHLPDSFPQPTDCTLWGEFGDLDGDDRLDLVTGQGECSGSDEVYLGNADMPTDSQEPLVIAVDLPAELEFGGAAAVGQAAISDRTVTDEGPRLARVWASLDSSAGVTEHDGWFIGGDLFRFEFDVPDAASVDIQLCAEDRAGNQGCSAARSITINGGSSGDGDGDPTGDGDGDPTGDGDGDGDPATGDGDGDPTSGNTETGNGETGGADSPADDDGAGCSCAQDPDTDPARGLASLGLLALAGLGLRRRRA